ncbi:uncharacterized protein DUF2029 [Frondihabitans australicus]|uniref:Uncharacterized protein DUF2029 n=1 Tax=Frondihabitans australicus TaxID=386892 RepID=A0A495IDV2_9MICO|nr:uncharacterized protein DUF2029 [Frondihabitans australicus]
MTSLLVVALGAVVWWGVTHLGFLSVVRRDVFVAWTLIAWAIFAVAAFTLRFVSRRSAEVLIVAGALVVGLAAICGPPNTSTDSARYAWDGIVQLHGLSPYAHVPASHVLTHLRPEWLFPTPSDAGGAAHCVGQRIMTTHETTTHALLCTAINRPHDNTIYPPMAELWFALVRSVVPVTATYWPMQVAGLLVSLGVTLGLLVVLRRSGRPAAWAVLWAWCPLVAAEAVTNSHVDVLGAALATTGALLLTLRRPILGGIALGAATAVKLIPAVVYGPLLGRRRTWAGVAAGVVTFGLLYVPYIVTTGAKVVGYLPGYLKEEGYDDGTRYALVSLLFHGHAATIAVGVLGLVALAITVRLTDSTRPWSGEVFLIGTVFLVLTPRYPWYVLLLIPFVVLSERWEWLGIGLAMTIRQLHASVHLYRETLGVAIVLIIVVTVIRTPRDEWRRLGRLLVGQRLADAAFGPARRAGG